MRFDGDAGCTIQEADCFRILQLRRMWAGAGLGNWAEEKIARASEGMLAALSGGEAGELRKEPDRLFGRTAPGGICACIGGGPADLLMDEPF